MTGWNFANQNQSDLSDRFFVYPNWSTKWRCRFLSRFWSSYHSL